MAADNLVPNNGTNKKVKWVLGNDPEAAATTIPSPGWSANSTAGVIDMINGRDGHNRQPTVPDATYSFTSYFDDIDWAPGTHFEAGQRGFLFVYSTDTRWRREPAIIMDYNEDAGNPGDPHTIAITAARQKGTAPTYGTDTP